MPYHHGNLAHALVDAGVALAQTGGPDAVVMRRVASLAGVSHNAAYRHFQDRDALMTEIAREALDRIAAQIELEVGLVDAVDDSDRAALRLLAVGRAYVNAALAEPGLFATAFVAPGITLEGAGPFEILTRELDNCLRAGLIRAEKRDGAELLCWSGVHGFAHLHLQGPLAQTPAQERALALEVTLIRLFEGLAS